MSDKEEMKKQETELEKQRKIGEENLKIVKNLVKEGKLPQPRGLNRKERKELDAADLNLFKIKPEDRRPYHEIREACADWIIDKLYPDFDFGDLPNNVCLWFGQHIFGLTYKDDLSEKN